MYAFVSPRATQQIDSFSVLHFKRLEIQYIQCLYNECSLCANIVFRLCCGHWSLIYLVMVLYLCWWCTLLSKIVIFSNLYPKLNDESYSYYFDYIVDEITTSFRKFGPLVVDWPHKAESKSYFPPKGYAFLLFQVRN